MLLYCPKKANRHDGCEDSDLINCDSVYAGFLQLLWKEKVRTDLVGLIIIKNKILELESHVDKDLSSKGSMIMTRYSENEKKEELSSLPLALQPLGTGKPSVSKAPCYCAIIFHNGRQQTSSQRRRNDDLRCFALHAHVRNLSQRTRRAS